MVIFFNFSQNENKICIRDENNCNRRDYVNYSNIPKIGEKLILLNKSGKKIYRIKSITWLLDEREPDRYVYTQFYAQLNLEEID